MPYDSRVYRILIASPSDVLEEREAAVRVMQDWNDLQSYSRLAVILPLRWETHAAPEYNVRPQESINRRIVDDCDMLVGIFWTKLGTPTGEADSGTLEEIERVAKAGKPVMLYFSHVPVDPNRVDLKQMELLKSFRERILANALVETFGSALDFRDKFANQLEMQIRDLQKADEAGQPLSLSLEFFSLHTEELVGSSLSTAADLLELSDRDVEVDGELMPYVEQVFQHARVEAALVPIVLAVKNISSSGIRNLYIEMSIKALEGAFQVSDSIPSGPGRLGWRSLFRTSFLESLVVMEPSEIVRKLAKFSGKGLEKDGDQWRFSFEWEAIQPQRVRLIQPFTFLQVASACRAEFSAKIYADSFANPIVLDAQCSIDVQPRLIQNDIIVAKAKELRDASARMTTATATFRDSDEEWKR